MEAVASKFNETHLGYAETCTLLSRFIDFQTNPGPLLFSNRPLKYLKLYLERMCTSSEELQRSKFVMLVFMSLNQSKIHLNKPNTGLRQLLEACNLSLQNVRLTSIIPEKFVVREGEEEYVLQHDVIQRMVLVVFGTRHFDKLVKFSSWNEVPHWIKATETKILKRVSGIPQKLNDSVGDIQPILEISQEQMAELQSKLKRIPEACEPDNILLKSENNEQ
jgi:hypothetical protein